MQGRTILLVPAHEPTCMDAVSSKLGICNILAKLNSAQDVKQSVRVMYAAGLLLLALQVSLAVCRPGRAEAAGLAAGQM